MSLGLSSGIIARAIKAEVRGEGRGKQREGNAVRGRFDLALSTFESRRVDVRDRALISDPDVPTEPPITRAPGCSRLKTLACFNLISHSIMHLSIIPLLCAFDVYRQNALAVD